MANPQLDGAVALRSLTGIPHAVDALPLATVLLEDAPDAARLLQDLMYIRDRLAVSGCPLGERYIRRPEEGVFVTAMALGLDALRPSFPCGVDWFAGSKIRQAIFCLLAYSLLWGCLHWDERKRQKTLAEVQELEGQGIHGDKGKGFIP